MVETNVSKRFLERLAVRDFDGLAVLLASDARARLLLPRGPEELAGRDQIVGRLRAWFAAASYFEAVSTGAEEVGGRQRLTWTLRVVRESDWPELVQQHAFVDLGPDGIERLDLLCSGFQPEPPASASGEPAVFDAGDLGCADGLAGEFRRRIECVPVGGRLVVVVSDPAAREDLPPLARMLGHAVQSTEALEDGRQAITVERRR